MEINWGRKCKACSTACNACSFVVFAGECLLPRGQVEGTQFQMTLYLCAGAGSAGFESASFGSLIASAFCPPTHWFPCPSQALFCLPCFSSQYLQPKLPQYWYYHGVTCISAEVNGFERGQFMCSERCMDPGLVNLTLWLIPSCAGETENSLNNPIGKKVLFHHSP